MFVEATAEHGGTVAAVADEAGYQASSESPTQSRGLLKGRFGELTGAYELTRIPKEAISLPCESTQASRREQVRFAHGNAGEADENRSQPGNITSPSGHEQVALWKCMSDPQKYTPLSERLQQDVWHDNFVPKYSALATAKPSRLVVVGVWLIFAPMALSSLIFGLSAVSYTHDLAATVISTVGSVLFFLLAVAILYTQTRRYYAAASEPDAE